MASNKDFAIRHHKNKLLDVYRALLKIHMIENHIHIKTCLWELSSIVINFKFLHNIKFYS